MLKRIRSQRGTASAAALVLAATLALAGCGGGQPASEDPNAPVTITLGVQTQTNQAKPFTNMVKAFEAANPNVTVNIVETPNADFGNVIRTQLSSGTAPDVFYGSPGKGNPNSLLPYAEAGYLLDITNESWAQNSVPASAKALYFDDDKQWALPLDIVPIPWVYNTEVFKDLKITPPDTFDGVLQACATAQKGNKNLIQLAGSLPPNTGLAALSIAATRVYAANPQWNDQRAAKQTTFAATPGWKETLDTFSQMKNANCFQKGAEAGTFDDLFSSVAQSKAGSLFAPAGARADLKALVPSVNIDFTAFPGDTAASSFMFASPSNALAINAKTKYPDASKKLMAYFASSEGRAKIVSLNGNVNLDVVLKGEKNPAEFADLDPWLTDPSKNAPLANLFWPNGSVYDALGKGVQGILTGQATSDQVLKNMDDAWDNG